jgi:nicotinamide-nucleotide amidase
VKAELLAIGSELLGPLRTETNSLWLTERLLDAGIEVTARATLADDQALLESAFREALARADVVIATGGLGPTADDLTREAAAAATGRGLRRDGAIVEVLRARFARFGRVMSATNEKQADRIEGAEALANARGTAPGQVLEREGRLLVLLPGPPGEMKPMFEEQVLPRLRARAGATRVVRRRVLRIAAMPESEVDELAAPVYSRFENPRTTILGAAGQVELHLVAHGDGAEDAERRIEALAEPLRTALPGRIYGEDGRDLPDVVVTLLRERSLSLALAESCTGGLLSSRLTEVPGASATLERAFVTYANRAKVEELGVDPGLLERDGAVSEAVAASMARGARRAAGAGVGVGITGIAGPDGGSAEKPVGLVFVALDGAAGTRVRRSVFPGGRSRVRFQATQVALEMLRRGLLGLPPL